MLQYFFMYDADIPEGNALKNFSAGHLTWLLVTLLLILLAVVIFRKKDVSARKRMLKAAAWAIVSLEFLRTVWLLAVGHYEVTKHLPLHLCGVMILVEFLAVFTNKRFFKEFAYAAGLPGALMALITPEPSGYPFFNIQYLESIAIHALLVLVPLLLVAGGGFRPSFRMLPVNLLALLGLTAACFFLNLALGSNYMFVHYAPQDTPIELFDAWLGWPGYIVLLLGTVFAFWILMYLPWEIVRRRKSGLPVNEALTEE